MPIANYSTTVEAIKSIGEIQGMLIAHGARAILMNFMKDGTIEALSFIVDTPYGEMPIKLPVDVEAILKVLKKQGVVPRYATHPQAVKIAWRITRDWIRAQMAYQETEMVKMEQIFLPYMITKDNRTLYEGMVDKKFYLEQGKQ